MLNFLDHHMHRQSTPYNHSHLAFVRKTSTDIKIVFKSLKKKKRKKLTIVKIGGHEISEKDIIN